MPDPTQPQVVWHEQAVSRAAREKLNGHRGVVVWFTGLSGSGKSTVAGAVDAKLHALGAHTYVLDGDNIRHGLSATPQMLAERHGEEFGKRFGLGFGAEDRTENIRRIGSVAQLLCDAGLLTLTAFVSPYRADRDAVRAALGEGDFVEVFVDTPLEVCERRDPKGLYKKARAGEIKGFTGIDDPYEAPLSPELTLAGGDADPGVLADRVIEHLRSTGKLGD
ncbi:Adenylyl-sulfate kinase [Pseudobythopirellula maris]|uniref:Adenylyl-sulfate kinase n=1 Tax=Pseudobythopirellula maris TaxID=2527991 RepID=A0A5C5ZGS0_9BACT|nr:adenylyl-sulfate kinase [Pseudobythopirellula maris]TWT86257.1 Adenylyl-sulfate kinase [Pseudobythopirellula maris]